MEIGPLLEPILTETKLDAGSGAAWLGCSAGHPVMIVPGFMSSGLQVAKSELVPGWVGEQIYINLKKLGVRKHEGSVDSPRASDNGDHSSLESEEDDEDEEDSISDERGKRVPPNYNFNGSEWVRHMSLSTTDCESDPPGFEVRPMEGCSAIDFLLDDKTGLIRGRSYVFSYLLQQLELVGYIRDENVQAAPYDWRVPFSTLEDRDGYFTKTADRIEEMVRTFGRRVVFLSHSMGGLVASYFLQHVHANRGETWIRENLEMFIALGCPWLGAAKSMRGLLLGDKMGLVLINSLEALLFGRSLGSIPWLLPQGGLAPTFTRDDSIYLLTIDRVDLSGSDEYSGCEAYVEASIGDGRRLRTGGSTGPIAIYGSTFQLFSSSKTPPKEDVLSLRVLKTSLGIKSRLVADVIDSGRLKLEEFLSSEGDFHGEIKLSTAGTPITIHLQLQSAEVLGNQRIEKDIMLFDEHHQASRDCTVDGAAPMYPDLSLPKNYSARSGAEILFLAGLADPLGHQHARRSSDPYFMRPPPIDHLVCVYGVNVDTEITTFLKRRECRITKAEGDNSERVARLFEVDPGVSSSEGFALRKGTLYETEATMQREMGTRKMKKISGDGTVPYVSLAICADWASADRVVDIEEIEGAKHRDILSDSRVALQVLKRVINPPHRVIIMERVTVTQVKVLVHLAHFKRHALRSSWKPSRNWFKQRSSSLDKAYVNVEYRGHKFKSAETLVGREDDSATFDLRTSKDGKMAFGTSREDDKDARLFEISVVVSNITVCTACFYMEAIPSDGSEFSATTNVRDCSLEFQLNSVWS